jgi:hypothetical protein
LKQIVEATGYCISHVRKVVGMTGREFSPEQCFWKYVEIIPDSCWTWKGSKAPFGYGHMSWNGKSNYAHRVSWMIHNGPIPDGMVVMHKCDCPECTNPDHLQLGTQIENMRDRDLKGRWREPSYEKVTKIPDETVLQIRRFYGRGLATLAELSRSTGVSYDHVWRITTNRTRKNVQAARDVTRLD